MLSHWIALNLIKGQRMARLSLSLLGLFQVTLDEKPVTNFESNKVRALLAYLAVEADRAHRREALAELLWPGRGERSALANLRYALYDLRNDIGDREADPPFLWITRRTLQFNRESDYTLDVEVFEERISDSAIQRFSESAIRSLQLAVSLYRGSFLEGFSVGDSPAFEEWTLFKREQIGRRMLSALYRLAAVYEQRGEYEQAQHCVRRQLELEPWQEEAHRQLMRLLTLSGQRSAALAQYETCRRLLAEELGVEPARETIALYESIRDGRLGDKETRRQGDSPRLPLSLSPSLPLSPFVGREHELAQLDGFLEAALAGQGRVVFVTGDAGSGKTALVNEFIRRAMETHSNVITVSGSCNAHTGIGDPYLPFREIVQLLTGDIEAKRAGGAITREHALRLWAVLPDAVQVLVDAGPNLIDLFVPGAALALRAEAFAPRGAIWRTRLDDLVQRAATHPGSTALQQADLFEQVTRVLQSLARQHPLILVLDDLQWADAGSISLLFHLGRRLAGHRILIVGAYRPGEAALGRSEERHPLEPIVNEFQRDFGDIQVDLAQANGRQFVEAFLESEPNRLSAAFRETLHQHTGGHPLFTVELLRGLRERGDLVRDETGRWMEGPTLDWEKLPARVEAVIAERLSRLPEEWQATLETASVEGGDFTAEVVARVQGLDEGEIAQRLSGALSKQHRLVAAQSLQRLGKQRLSRYRFRHYLFQKYLYNRLDEVERARLHEAVGNALETLYEGNEVQAGIVPSAVVVHLARHFEAAGMVNKAADYLFRAGKRAVQMSAHKEAIAHYTRGIELLRTQSDSPERAQRELVLQIALGTPLQALKSYGAPERGRAYARARELSLQIGQTSDIFETLLLQWSFDMPRAKHRQAFALAEQLFDLARQMQDPAQMAVAHATLGISLLYLGKFTRARVHLDRALAGYDPQQHHSLAIPIGQDLKVTCLAYSSWILWFLGYPDQALRQTREVITLARELEHPYSLGFALGIAGCVVHLRCGKYDAAMEEAETLLQLWEEQGFALYQAWGMCVKGRVLTEWGQMEEGIATLRKGVAACKSVGIIASHTQQLANFAEACRNAGQVEEGLDVVAEALALVEETGERHFEADLYLRKGELLLMLGDDDQITAEANNCLRRAIEIARRQKAKSWELRAVMILCRLWHRQGKREEARQLLAEMYGWFTEGFDTLDLQKAKSLLEAW
jgi:predicted ATPase/DNA-binding SARP family transcriptional activator